MRNPGTELPLLSTEITEFKQQLSVRYGKNKGLFSTTLEGDGARLESVADTLLQAIKDESTTPDIARMSFAALQNCSEQLRILDEDTAKAFDRKGVEKKQLYAILTHIQNANRKTPENEKQIKDNIRQTAMNDIWRDIDQIREDKQNANWSALKTILFGLACAAVIAVIVTAMLTPVGWVGVGAFFIGVAIHFSYPILMQVVAALSIFAVTLGFMKVVRPIDHYAFESELSNRTAQEMSTQKRKSMDELNKFHKANVAPEDDETVDMDDDESVGQTSTNTAPYASRGSKNGPTGSAQQTTAQGPVWGGELSDSDDSQMAQTTNRQAPPQQNRQQASGNASPRQQNSRQVSSSVMPLQQNSRQVSSSAMPLQQNSRQVSSSAMPLQQNSRQVSSSAMPPQQNSRQVSSSVMPQQQTRQQASSSVMPQQQDWQQTRDHFDRDIDATNYRSTPQGPSRRGSQDAARHASRSFVEPSRHRSESPVYNRDSRRDQAPDRASSGDRRRDEYDTQDRHRSRHSSSYDHARNSTGRSKSTVSGVRERERGKERERGRDQDNEQYRDSEYKSRR